MAAEHWMQKVSGLGNSDKIASFLDKLKQKISQFMITTQSGGPTDLIGLDIAPDRVKILKINSSATPYQVTAFSAAPLPPGVIVKDEIKDPAAISAVIKEMLRSSGISAKFAAVAIPRTLAIIKNITVDKRFSADDIESRAWIEANRLFPDLVGNIYLDFTVTGASVQAPDQLDLLLVACRKEHIKGYLDVVQQSGLIPKIVDVNCYALERSLQLFIADKPEMRVVALLNVNYTQSSLIVIQNGQLIHAHDQTFDGNRLLKQVDDFAKKRQEQPGMENVPVSISDAAYDALLKENFLSHLRHTIHFFYSSRSNIAIEQIILAGDCTVVPDFSAFIEREIGVKTTLADPFLDMKINSWLNVEEIKKTAPTLMLCSGLALSNTGD